MPDPVVERPFVAETVSNPKNEPVIGAENAVVEGREGFLKRVLGGLIRRNKKSPEGIVTPNLNRFIPMKPEELNRRYPGGEPAQAVEASEVDADLKEPEPKLDLRDALAQRMVAIGQFFNQHRNNAGEAVREMAVSGGTFAVSDLVLARVAEAGLGLGERASKMLASSLSTKRGGVEGAK